MGLTLTLTDKEIPASPAFIDFVHTALFGGDYYAAEWYAQEEEALTGNDGHFKDIGEKAKQVISDPRGQQIVTRSYRYFKEMLTGKLDTLKLVARFRFFFVVGIPRTGGTYLTKQLFRACGVDYKNVQNALAHDGFPHLAFLSFKHDANIHTNSLLQLAEYLTMVDIYFTQHGKLAYRGGVVVPKKFTKGVYNFPLVRELFGNSSEYLVTLRHPLSMINSTLEKSGGMPEDGKFKIRSAIERWAFDDWVHWGTPEAQVLQQDYIGVFLNYWKRFHFQVAMSGIPFMPTCRLVPFGKEHMEGTVAELFKAFDVDMEPEPFKAVEPPSFDKKYEDAAEKVMQEVTDFWTSMGLKFPLDALREKH